MFAKLVLAGERGFLGGGPRLMMVGGQDGHWVRAPSNEFTFGWAYTTKKTFDKRSVEKHIDD